MLFGVWLPSERTHHDLLDTLKAMRHRLGLGDEVCAVTRGLDGRLRLHRPRELARGRTSFWLAVARRAIELRDLQAQDPASPLAPVLRPGTGSLLILTSAASMVTGVRALAGKLGCTLVPFPPDREIELLLQLTRPRFKAAGLQAR